VAPQNLWLESWPIGDSDVRFRGMAGQMNGCDSAPEFRDESAVVGEAHVFA